MVVTQNPLVSLSAWFKAALKRPRYLHLLILIYLVFLSVIIRFPFFFVDTLNWDESTFILVGQSFLEGHLPYTELWDNKSPLLFTAFAIFITTLGKSLFSIRLAGSLCVALIAWFTYLIGVKIKSYRIGIMSSTLTVLGISVLIRGFASTMSEHIAMVPLMGALFLLMERRVSLWRIFGVGILMAIAAMVRLNLAYAIITMGFAILFIIPLQFSGWKRHIISYLKRAAIYSLGVIFVITSTLVPYLLTNQASIWWNSVILIPLSYSGSSQGTSLHIWVIVGFVKRLVILFISHAEGISFLPSSQAIFAIFLFVGSLLGLSKSFAYLRDESNFFVRRYTLLLIFAFGGIALSIIRGGQPNFHYLIQIIPLISLLAAFTYEQVLQDQPRLHLTLSIALIIIFTLGSVGAEYQQLLARVQSGGNVKTGVAYEIAQYFNDRPISDEQSVYMMTAHIAYWFIDRQPLTHLSTHPSSIVEHTYLPIKLGSEATPEMGLAEVLDLEPDFIVKEPEVWYLEREPAVQQLLDQTLAAHYVLIKEIQKNVREQLFLNDYVLAERLQQIQIYERVSTTS